MESIIGSFGNAKAFSLEKAERKVQTCSVALLKEKCHEKHDGLQALFHLSQCNLIMPEGHSIFDLKESQHKKYWKRCGEMTCSVTSLKADIGVPFL